MTRYRFLCIIILALVRNALQLERYRSGHNEAVLKTVCPQGHMGSNPILSARRLSRLKKNSKEFFFCVNIISSRERKWFEQLYGEVPKLAEGTPLERVQVVNSGARVQIPPSPLSIKKHEKSCWQTIGYMIIWLSCRKEQQIKNKKVVDKRLNIW